MTEKKEARPLVAKIMGCSCKNEGQDKLHGKNNRVWNMLTPIKDRPDRFRCTVCGALK